MAAGEAEPAVQAAAARRAARPAAGARAGGEEGEHRAAHRHVVRGAAQTQVGSRNTILTLCIVSKHWIGENPCISVDVFMVRVALLQLYGLMVND